MSDNNKDFDLSAEYEAQVRPLMDQVFEKCKELGIPMMSSFNVGLSGNKRQMRSSSLNGIEGRVCLELVACTDLVTGEMIPQARRDVLRATHMKRGGPEAAVGGFLGMLIEALGKCDDPECDSCNKPEDEDKPNEG